MSEDKRKIPCWRRPTRRWRRLATLFGPSVGDALLATTKFHDGHCQAPPPLPAPGRRSRRGTWAVVVAAVVVVVGFCKYWLLTQITSRESNSARVLCCTNSPFFLKHPSSIFYYVYVRFPHLNIMIVFPTFFLSQLEKNKRVAAFGCSSFFFLSEHSQNSFLYIQNAT